MTRVLCLGNNTEDTHYRTQQLANESQTECHGLISELDRALTDDELKSPGYYHSSIYDIEFGRLIEIGNQFDLVIMLNQSIDRWSHPQAFYNTIRVMKSLTCPTRFQDRSFVEKIEYWERLLKTNTSFCIFPFIELLVNHDHTTVCCRSTQPIVHINALKDYQNDPNYVKLRKKMIQGERLPNHCQSCYDLEDHGMVSARQQETVEWANRLKLESLEDVIKIQHPIYYEVRPSNKCNLLCRTCHPGSSHLIDREYRQIKLIDSTSPPRKRSGGGFEIVKFDNIKKIYIAGGEPLIMKELYQFLDQCATENHTDIEIIINTNGTKLSEKFTNVIGRFTNLQFIFSIDGAKEMNNYIRWGSDWKTIIKNWHYLRNHNHKVMVNTTVSIYNIHRLHEICDFIDKHFPNTLLHLQTLQTPQYLSPFLFPNPNLVLDSLNLVQKSQCYKNDPLLTSTIDGYVRWFASGKKYQNSSLGEFFKFNDLLDQSRAVRLADYDAILDSFRNTC